MLRALELIGFKSFADKTRFEFAHGITAVVGPNGSGKSNIVDAIKWVLGEQSVKSLRGKEMADVIFNGSGTRRAMNSAEITLTFDNSRNLFPLESPEVHITRRIYRSGEGEYLINRQPSRLRDIRELLSVTGIGTHAHTIIEQGKVDILLQSSARERRIIFEEAAGISLFKTKKLEALRRLERVEQNLLRLSDIVDEVESRLRSVRNQAGKARRFKEYNDRLQELRTQVGLIDWCRLSEKLDQIEGELKSLRESRDGETARAEAIEAEALELERQAEELSEAIRRHEAEIAGNREQIAAKESTIEHERKRGREFESEITRRRGQLAVLNGRINDVRIQLRDVAEETKTAQVRHSEIAAGLADDVRRIEEVDREITALREEYATLRTTRDTHRSELATSGAQIGSLQTKVQTATEAEETNQSRVKELEGELRELRDELEELKHHDRQLLEELESRENGVDRAREKLHAAREERRRAQAEIDRLKERYNEAAHRADVLEDLEKRNEGLGAGVKHVLAIKRDEPEGPFSEVVGLVADLFHVSVESAPLIEIALGSRAERLVVEPGGRLLSYLKQLKTPLPGRTGFIWLDRETASDAASDYEGKPGVLGRGDRFVDTEPDIAPLTRRLLGNVWFVESLAHGLALREKDGGKCRFITLAGELLEPDGTVLLGPHHASGGLIARRSELRAVNARKAELQMELGRLKDALTDLDAQVKTAERNLERAVEHAKQTQQEREQHRHAITGAEVRQVQFTKQREARVAECEAAARQKKEASADLEAAQGRHEEAKRELETVESCVKEKGEQIAATEERRAENDRRTMAVKVELAKSEERLNNLLAQKSQFEETLQEREKAVTEYRERLAECLDRAKQTDWTLLRDEAAIAELYLRKETLIRQTGKLVADRETFASNRAGLNREAGRHQAKARKIEERIHEKDLSAGEVRHERTTLAERLREDYSIDLAELEGKASDEEQRRREEWQTEINDLRRKISNLGNVNLEALAELEELDSRYENLAGQYKDLSEAKDSLQRIIDKINADSRRLFAETLETVRGHFQTLFRDLFGGGQADILLDEGVDILESGVEIVARPPGKEPRNISLLSGGEKTLTCVALLLAIFRGRPSPFCVLDEVDAALDEANIGRFTQVLKDFLAWTQFIIVTHSKKTMTCAAAIYGVTMQESGISKQVSVRFDDVSEDGHIREEAFQKGRQVENAATDEADSDETEAA